MARHKKVYGFTIALSEGPRTCPSLFRHVADYKESLDIPSTTLWKAMIAPSWVPWPFRGILSKIFNLSHTDRHGDGWNLCHYWSNFEIADLDFFRGRGYQDLVESLDKSGGFYFERVSLPFHFPPSFSKEHPANILILTHYAIVGRRGGTLPSTGYAPRRRADTPFPGYRVPT